MDTSSKNLLQEYCMKNKCILPNYRITQQIGPPHAFKFQVEVEVNNQKFISDELYSSKKQAEQSAARQALQNLVHNNTNKIILTDYCENELDLPPSYAETMKLNSMEHLPDEYFDVERSISTMVGLFAGRIRKIWAPNIDGLYQFDITGYYRFCDNIKRNHRRNRIYFMVDPINRTYYQMCYDPECFQFRSITKNLL